MGMGVGIEIPSPRQPWPGVRNEGQKPETQGPTAEVVFLGSAVSSPSGVQGGVPVVKGFFCIREAPDCLSWNLDKDKFGGITSLPLLPFNPPMDKSIHNVK